MQNYEVGYIFIRCFLQKPLQISDTTEAIPIGRTGFKGEIHDVRKLLADIHFDFTRNDLQRSVENFANTGQCALVRLRATRAASFQDAIAASEKEALAAAGALAVISANAVEPLCAYAKSPADSGVRFFIPYDRTIRHGTNIGGYLDAVPDIAAQALVDEKYTGLLRLYRASLRENELDHQLLFQLIIFEEASDSEAGSLAERIRAFAQRHGFEGDINVVASECGLTLPQGKDMVDVIVKLRNSAAHNGRIDEETLREFNGTWVLPLVRDKEKLHRAISEALRYMFCALVGHTRDTMATLITQETQIHFN